MKQRILTGWNIRRILYMLTGITFIYMSAVEHEWAGILLGAYFAAMGFFAFGCASGNCFGGSCDTIRNTSRLNH